MAPILRLSTIVVALWLSRAVASPDVPRAPGPADAPPAPHRVAVAQPEFPAGRSAAQLLTTAPPVTQQQEELGRGKFLIAARQLQDPNFSQTVVLLLDYNPEGALGVIINRPTSIALSSMLPDVAALRERADTVFEGGPVARDRMVVLIRSEEPPIRSGEIMAGVYVSANLETLRALLEDPKGRGKFHAYVGYAGWAPGQLDGEVARGDWHISLADAGIVFDKEASRIWPEMIEKNAGTWVQAPIWLQASVAR